jgi:topoisomerase-4 subunit A
VEIEIVPQRGYDPEKAIQALYAYTACQSSISVDMMVICENKPVQMSVSQVLRRNTDRLVDLLRAELEIEIGKMLDKLMGRTLAQIFVEEGVYKRIEKCKTYELILKEVRAGLEKFRSEWQPILDMLKESIARRGVPDAEAELKAKASQIEKGELPDSEIERLLEIPIRRISLFDIQKNKEEMELLRQSLDEANKNLKRIKAYAIRYLKACSTNTATSSRAAPPSCARLHQDRQERSGAQQHKVYWTARAATSAPPSRATNTWSATVRPPALRRAQGRIQVIGIPDKFFIDRLYEFRKYDKTTDFGVVYSESATGKCYYKRCSIASFIKDKEYRICPEGCRLELITPRPRALYECQIDTPIKARKIQIIDLSEAPLRSPKASGLKFSDRKLLKITFVKYLDEAEVEGGSSDEGRRRRFRGRRKLLRNA